MTDLNRLGWNNFYEKHFQQFNEQGFSKGRITAENKTNFLLYTEHGEVLGEVSGKLMYCTENQAELPKTGDWVVISLFDDNTKAIIHEVLPRKTKLSRKAPDKKIEEQVIATNVDIVFIMQSLDNNFNINRLQRYIISVRESKAIPVVVLSKADLCSDAEAKLQEAMAAVPGVDVTVISSLTKQGIDNIRKFISDNTTVAVVGSSGVGKSTMINLLCSEQSFAERDAASMTEPVKLATGEVRSSDSRGRHTTTRRELVLLPSGGMIIDTPGMREFALWNSDAGFAETFSEFGNLAEDCQYKDCTHTHENNCAVKAALDEGKISQESYANYLKLRKELHYLETKQDIYAQLEEKRKWKNIHKEIKRLNKK